MLSLLCEEACLGDVTIPDLLQTKGASHSTRLSCPCRLHHRSCSEARPLKGYCSQHTLSVTLFSKIAGTFISKREGLDWAESYQHGTQHAACGAHPALQDHPSEQRPALKLSQSLTAAFREKKFCMFHRLEHKKGRAASELRPVLPAHLLHPISISCSRHCESSRWPRCSPGCCDGLECWL